MRHTIRIRVNALALRLMPPVLRRFVREKDGSVAVEFSFIMVPFLAILFAIIETAMVFFASQVLETATGDAARMIMTGQAQVGQFDAARFKKEVCDRLYRMFDCQNGVFLDVRKYDKFSNVTLTRPVDPDKKFINDFTYAPGGPGCITVVRVFYQWPVHLAIGSFDLSNIENNKRLLSATAAFRNEPYATGSGTC